ncbi:hypothetical protein [Calothrix sp. 336/3]|uniref:hypothetical protein n=1 Tax=Calothrix sp. 336/3 TaxID=1337936 RepID=UPI0004E30262|nr:hypothetical protein [Calothrix sp. 336/3]AKG24353.1 hypothetical protein IJ00_00235 [Calothrix sp. 336/3]
MEQLQVEITALEAEIATLLQERTDLGKDIMLPTDDAPPPILVVAYRRLARENPELFAELKGIDDAIAALENQLTKKQLQLQRLIPQARRAYQEQQLEEARQQAQIHADRINEIAAQLAIEIRALKACADELSPLYWQVYYKPFITGFKTISVPYIRSDGDVWTIVNRIV